MITGGSISLAITIPGEGLTRCCQCVGSESIVNGEFQSHGILASLCICKYVVMITTGCIGLTITVPCKGLTSCYQCISSESIVNSKFQSHGILATLRICKCVVMITTGCVGLTITAPCIGVTGCYQCIGSESIVNSKFQSHGILATLRICKYVVMITCDCISLPITVPCTGLTSCYQCVGSESIVNGEFQSYRILATLRICEYVVMITRGSISLAITIPGEGLTGRYQCISPDSIVNGEFQSYSILATLRICKYVIMITGGSISLTV